jgi:hypothetical protein
MKRISFAVLLVCTLVAVASVVAQVPPPKDAEAVLSKSYTGKSYSPYAQRGFPSRPYWGDTHLHTDISMDAGAFGNRLGLDEGYRFARGDEVVSSNGTPARLSRPLDFLVIADHSETWASSRTCAPVSSTSSRIQSAEIGTSASSGVKASA